MSQAASNQGPKSGEETQVWTPPEHLDPGRNSNDMTRWQGPDESRTAA